MAKDRSTQIRDFVKNSLATYYKNFQIKLDTPEASDVNAAIKIGNKKYQGGGEVYIWGLGGYGEGESGYDIDNAITLQDIIHDLSNNISKADSSIQNINSSIQNINSSIQDLSNNKISINADANIKVEKNGADISISALGYTYNQEKNSFVELNSNIATGTNSHAEGYHTTAKNEAEHAEGKYNVSNTGTIHSVGIGSSSQSKNALEILNDGSIFITGLNTARTYVGTSITNVSTLQEVINEKLDKSSAAAGLRYEVVQQLPANPELSVIYLVPSTTSTAGNVYDEKMYINNTWETIGSTQADLTNYYIKSETDELIEDVSLKAGNNIEITQDNSINALGYVYDSPTSAILIGQMWVDPIANDKFVVGSGYQATPRNSFRINANGGQSTVYINESYADPNAKTYVQGDVSISRNLTIIQNATAAAFYQSSDERLKNIKSELSVEDCYKLINDCSTIIYSLKTDEKDQNQIGMVAQQVKEIMPEVVQESNSYYSINYSRLSVVALNLIKDLSERIIELEKDHNKLEELIKRVEKLEK